jgi:hypothetical protein
VIFSVPVKNPGLNMLEDWKVYKILRNQTSRALKSAEALYWKELLGEQQKGSSNYWKIIKKITNSDQKHKRMGPIKDNSGKTILDGKEKCNTMNCFFSSVGENLASHFQSQPVNPLVAFFKRVTPTIDEVDLNNEIFHTKTEQNQYQQGWWS